LILGLMIVALLWFILATSSTRKNTVSLSDGRPRVVLLENSPKEAMLRHPSDFLPLFSQRMVEPMITQEQQEALEDSNDYNHRAADVFETLDCQAQYPWQLSVFPNCNSIHEMDMTRIVSPSSHGGAIQPLNHGFWRDVWSRAPTWPDQDPMVLKTMRFEHNVTGRNFDRNRRDALVTERLTKSTWILNGYGFCGNTGVSEYAGGGDISAAIWKKSPLNPDYRIAIDMTTREQLIIGVQAAIGLAELHTFDDKDRPSVAHTDITPGQFVKVNDRFKLNDFNRARFIRVSKNHSLCSFAISKNPGKNRSPEEYTRHALLSEKIDLYSLGNIFYMLLQKQWVSNSFESIKDGLSTTTKDWEKNLSSHFSFLFLKAVSRRKYEGSAKNGEAWVSAKFL